MKSAVLSFVPVAIAPAVCAASIAVCLLTFALPARAASLTDEQLGNVQHLLASYGVDQAKIKAVSAVLTDQGTSPNVASDARCAIPTRALVRGMRSKDVSTLQQRLTDEGYLSADNVSGFFGETTETALKQWQADQGIAATGTPETTGWGAVGKKTIAALGHCIQKVRMMEKRDAEHGTTTPPMPPKHPEPMFPGDSGTPVPTAAPQGEQSMKSVMRFVADYSDAFNQNMGAVVAAPYQVYVPLLSDFFTSVGV